MEHAMTTRKRKQRDKDMDLRSIQFQHHVTRHMSPAELRKALDLLEISQRNFSKVVGYDERVIRRWVSHDDPTKIPESVAILVRLMVDGLISKEDVEARARKRKP